MTLPKNVLWEVATKLGVPCAILAFIGAFFWSFWCWLAPQAERVIDSHIKTMDQLGVTQSQIVDTQNDLKDLIKANGDRCIATLEKLDEIHDELQSMNRNDTEASSDN